MNRTLLMMLAVAVVMGATTAQADGFRHGHVRPAVPVQGPFTQYGPRPMHPPVGHTWQHGQYQLQTVQRWVPPSQQQVWVEGRCHGRFNQRCFPGRYEVRTVPGHFVTVQEWVWVPTRVVHHTSTFGVQFSVY
jgi:hypothetical protein